MQAGRLILNVGGTRPQASVPDGMRRKKKRKHDDSTLSFLPVEAKKLQILANKTFPPW